MPVPEDDTTVGSDQLRATVVRDAMITESKVQSFAENNSWRDT